MFVIDQVMTRVNRSNVLLLLLLCIHEQISQQNLDVPTFARLANNSNPMHREKVDCNLI
jgi:hypothetical protein